MTILGTLGIILLLAFTLEAMIEYFLGAWFEHVPQVQKYKWLTIYIAAVAGVVGAIIYQFDLIYLIGQWLETPIKSHIFGVVLTGLAIGRGSNFIHDLIKRFFASNEPRVVIGLVDKPSSRPEG
jgi:hypothetical protein